MGLEKHPESFYERRSLDKVPTSDNPENDAVLRKAWHALRLAPGDFVLDFGCADGYFISTIKDRMPSVNAYGVDLVKHSAWTQRGYAVEFHAGRLPLPFTDGYFDAVYSSQVLEHLQDPALAASELCRVLRPGGRMWIATPNSYEDTWKPFHSLQRRIDNIEGHFRHFSADELRSLFSQYGCKVVDVRYDLFLGLYLYYRFISYNITLKKRLLKSIAPELVATSCRNGAIGSKKNGWRRALKGMAFAALRILRAFDELFSRSSFCQVVEVSLTKNHA